MAMELVTGHAGAAHVSGVDVGAFNAKTIGNATYILDAELPTLTMTDANTLTVPVCEVLAQGRHVRITAPESVTIESGSQTGYRNDIVFLRYTLESTTSVESVELVPVTGTTVASQSDVVDPTTEYSSASILDGATTVDIPFVRIRLAGLTPTPEWIVSSQDTLDTAWGVLKGIVHVERVPVTITRTLGQSANVVAPAVAGYKFVCWVATATSGWTAPTYIASANSASSQVFVAASTYSGGTGTVNCYALYMPNL